MSKVTYSVELHCLPKEHDPHQYDQVIHIQKVPFGVRVSDNLKNNPQVSFPLIGRAQDLTEEEQIVRGVIRKEANLVRKQSLFWRQGRVYRTTYEIIEPPH